MAKEMKLSILICTVPSRVDTYLPKMVKSLMKQKVKGVEILWFGDSKDRSVGQKRNDLLSLAQGEYVTFVDDDDRVTDDYVLQILNGISTGADVVNFKVSCSVNSGEYRDVFYDARFLHNENFSDHYNREPNHIMCVKRVLALQAGFPLKNMGEDDIYAKRLKPLIKNQAFIDKVLYYYDFFNTVSETQ